MSLVQGLAMQLLQDLEDLLEGLLVPPVCGRGQARELPGLDRLLVVQHADR
jgi:hypothetical protein